MESQTITSSVSTTARPRSPFANLSFVLLWSGQLISMLGNNIYGLALMWEMKVLTGSTVMMSMVSVAMLLPFLIAGPFAGVLVDRWHKRTAMIGSDVVRAVVITILTLMVFTHTVAPWMLLVGAALNSFASSVFTPADSAIVPLLVGKESLQQANSITQGTTVLTQIVGPFLGGFLVANVSMTMAFAANATSFLISVATLLLMTYREPHREVKELSGRQFWTEMKEGFNVIRDIRLLRTIIPIGLIANFLFAPIELVLIQYSTVILHAGAQMYGILGACFSAGMFVGAVLAGTLANKFRRGHLIAIAFPICTLCIFGLTFVSTPWLAMVLLGISGLANMIVNILLMTIMQMFIPQDKMGRVFGTFGTLIQGSQPLALAIGGYLLAIMTVPVLFAIMGILATIDALVAGCLKVVREVA